MSSVFMGPVIIAVVASTIVAPILLKIAFANRKDRHAPEEAVQAESELVKNYNIAVNSHHNEHGAPVKRKSTSLCPRYPTTKNNRFRSNKNRPGLQKARAVLLFIGIIRLRGISGPGRRLCRRGLSHAAGQGTPAGPCGRAWGRPHASRSTWGRWCWRNGPSALPAN